MSDRYDDAARDLVRRAFNADPHMADCTFTNRPADFWHSATATPGLRYPAAQAWTAVRSQTRSQATREFINTSPRTASTKIVVAGACGVGKTTLIKSLSEIVPLLTEVPITTYNDFDSPPKTTTVAIDFGRIMLANNLALYLFGTPGNYRFWFMWDSLICGASGAIVLVDPRRMENSLGVIDYFEHHELPFLVAINEFDDGFPWTIDEIRQKLDLDQDVPILSIDARCHESGKQALVATIEYVLQTRVVPSALK